MDKKLFDPPHVVDDVPAIIPQPPEKNPEDVDPTTFSVEVILLETGRQIAQILKKQIEEKNVVIAILKKRRDLDQRMYMRFLEGLLPLKNQTPLRTMMNRLW